MLCALQRLARILNTLQNRKCQSALLGKRMRISAQVPDRPSQPSRRAADNKNLAQRLKWNLNDDEIAYRKLKSLTSRYRLGEVSAVTLQQAFVKILGPGKETKEILSSIAELIGPGERQSTLLSAAEEDIRFDDFTSWEKAEVADKISDSLVSQVDDQLMAAGKKRQRTDQPTSKEDRKSPSSSGKSNRSRSEEEPQAKASRGQCVLLWLKMDLRIHDQPALNAAAKRAEKLGSSLAFCFIHSPDQDGDRIDQGDQSDELQVAASFTTLLLPVFLFFLTMS